MLIGLPPIFVANAKIIYGYNFAAPLKSLANLNEITVYFYP